MKNSINSCVPGTMDLLIARAEDELREAYAARDNGFGRCGHWHYEELCRASRGGGTPSPELLARHAREEAAERDEDDRLYEEEKAAERWLSCLLA